MKLFTDHPASVGETYVEHLRAASGFGLAMVASGIACLIHGLVPPLFIRTGSRTVQRLYTQMVTTRGGRNAAAPADPAR